MIQLDWVAPPTARVVRDGEERELPLDEVQRAATVSACGPARKCRSMAA